MSEDASDGPGGGDSGAVDAGAADQGADPGDPSDDAAGARERIEESAESAVEEFDERVVEVLSWVLDTETRARIYVYLRSQPGSTSDEVADGTGLYPSTAREALADLAAESVVERTKRQSSGAGNNPYEYRAIAPSELVRRTVGQLQDQLNAVCNLEALRDGGEDDDAGPVTIQVEPEDGR